MPKTPKKVSKIVSLPQSAGAHDLVPTSAFDEFIKRHDDAIIIYEEAAFIGCNQAALNLLGYGDVSHLEGCHPADLSPAIQSDGRDSRESMEEMLRTARQHGSHRFEWTHKTAEGISIPLEILMTAVHVDGRHQVHALCRDISEYKVLQDQLRHIQKMEAMGKLAGGIAHDFNNFLVVVLGRAELLEHSLLDDEHNLAHVKEIKLAGERGAALVRQLLTFGRKQPIERTTLELRQAVDEARALMTPLLGEHINLHIHHTQSPLWVKGDQRQIEQILMNLASNAHDAMSGGGTLLVQTDCLEVKPKNKSSGVEKRARVSVSDNGIGMSEDILRMVLDPFFTTKEVGDGTGLGLSTVYGIVMQNDGDLQIKSTPGQGTSIEIEFPLSDAPPLAKSLDPSKAITPTNSETILLVEDDRSVFDLTARVLQNAGFTVLTARNGEEAFNLMQDRPHVDLMISDVVMPRMGGPDLYEALHAQGIVPPTLFMSGYAGDALRQAHTIRDTPLISKPFTPSALIERVREMLKQIERRKKRNTAK